MTQDLRSDAGAAIVWKTLQMAGTKLVFFVRLFVLARLLTPADFGLMAVAMVAIDVLVSLTNFGMIPALVQKQDAHPGHYDAAWTVGILRSVAISGVVLLGAPIISQIVGEPDVRDLVRVLALLPTIDGAASIGIARLTRRLAFRELAFADLARTILNTIVSIALAPWVGVWALVAGSLSGSLTYTVSSYIVAPHRPRFTVNVRQIRPLIRFGRWIFLTSLVAVSGSAVLRVVISRELGPAELGLYYLAARLAFLPTEVASDVIGSVAFPLYSRLQSQRSEVAQVLRLNLVVVLALLTPVFVLIGVLSPGLVEHILGERWQGTELLIQLLVAVGILGLLPDVAVPAVKGLGKPSGFTLIEAVQSGLLIAFVFALTNRIGLLGAPLAWFPAILGSMAVAFFFLRNTVRRPFLGLGRILSQILLISALSGTAAHLLYVWLPTMTGLILAGILGSGVAVVLTYYADKRHNQVIRTGIREFFPKIATMARL
jgi:PST family polysaccharide transporter/lipopolysaccharide exporter